MAIAIWALGSRRFDIMAGTSPRSMLSAVIIFFSSTLSGVIIGVFGGPIVDILDSTFRNMGWFQYPAWGIMQDMTSQSIYSTASHTFFQSSGLYVLFSTIYHRYGRDRSQPEDDEEIYLIDSGRL